LAWPSPRLRGLDQLATTWAQRARDRDSAHAHTHTGTSEGGTDAQRQACQKLVATAQCVQTHDRCDVQAHVAGRCIPLRHSLDF